MHGDEHMETRRSSDMVKNMPNLTRAALAGTLLIAVLVGGFLISAVNTITDDDWFHDE